MAFVIAKIVFLAIFTPFPSVDSLRAVGLFGTGASFPGVVYGDWLTAYYYERDPFVMVIGRYISINSHWGIFQTVVDPNGTVTQFGGTDVLPDHTSNNSDYLYIPVIAGGVAVAYNVPGITKLNLTRAVLVGIYNGTVTHWNDSAIQEVNPDVQMPSSKIRPIARSDTSGTTAIFTSALSAFDENWRQEKGTFSEGVTIDETSDGITPVHWDASVVRDFGETSRGMVGLIYSVKHSIGYISQPEAMVSHIEGASIVNKNGKLVRISPTSILPIVDQECDLPNETNPWPLVDSNSSEAYPIIGYSYVIVRQSGMIDCSSAVELVRYIEFVHTGIRPALGALHYNMAQLPNCISDKVTERYLKTITCGLENQNVYELLQVQRKQEQIAKESWRLPVAIAVPLVIAFFSAYVGSVVYQKMRINKTLLRENWKIACKDILIQWDREKGWLQSNYTASFLFGSTLTAGGSYRAGVPTISGWAKYVAMVGTWHDRKIFLRKIGHLDIDTKRNDVTMKLAQLMHKISNINILKFYGVTYFGEHAFLVSDHAEKGSLHDVLHHSKYTIAVDFMYSMAWDVALGMNYLHSSGIIHGELNSECCLLDGWWNIKITNWEYNLLLTGSKSMEQRRGSLSVGFSEPISEEDPEGMAHKLLWAAPELLRSVSVHPNVKTDVYSFSMLMIEIFTRDDPYYEYTATGRLTKAEIVTKIQSSLFRPSIEDAVPDAVLEIIKASWGENPERRPSFSSLLKWLNSERPSKTTILESMMETLEGYAGELEERVTDRTLELAAVNKNMENLLHQMLPPSVADSLRHGISVEPEQFASATVYFSAIYDFLGITAASNPLDIVTFLNDLYTVFDRVIASMPVYKVETIGDAYMCISGLPVRNGSHHAEHIANMALCLMEASRKFQIRHLPEQQLHLRAGVHSGPVVAGVVGRKTPRYCIFGDTVNTAARMESTSLPQRIQISKATHALLIKLGGYFMTSRGQVDVKGKGSLHTYFLESVVPKQERHVEDLHPITELAS